MREIIRLHVFELCPDKMLSQPTSQVSKGETLDKTITGVLEGVTSDGSGLPGYQQVHSVPRAASS